MAPKEEQESFGNHLATPISPVERGASPNVIDKIQQDLNDLELEEVEQILNNDEKNFLLQVERGDVASVQQ